MNTAPANLEEFVQHLGWLITAADWLLREKGPLALTPQERITDAAKAIAAAKEAMGPTLHAWHLTEGQKYVAAYEAEAIKKGIALMKGQDFPTMQELQAAHDNHGMATVAAVFLAKWRTREADHVATLRSIAEMPEIDQDDAHRLRRKAAEALELCRAQPEPIVTE